MYQSPLRHNARPRRAGIGAQIRFFVQTIVRLPQILNDLRGIGSFNPL
jgi:hypothetical protein